MKRDMNERQPNTLYIKNMFLYDNQTFDLKRKLFEKNDAWLDDVVSG